MAGMTKALGAQMIMDWLEQNKLGNHAFAVAKIF